MSSPENGGARNAPTRARHHEHPEDDVAQAVAEERTQARTREALEAADHPHQAGDEPLLALAGELEIAPASAAATRSRGRR